MSRYAKFLSPFRATITVDPNYFGDLLGKIIVQDNVSEAYLLANCIVSDITSYFVIREPDGFSLHVGVDISANLRSVNARLFLGYVDSDTFNSFAGNLSKVVRVIKGNALATQAMMTPQPYRIVVLPPVRGGDKCEICFLAAIAPAQSRAISRIIHSILDTSFKRLIK